MRTAPGANGRSRSSRAQVARVAEALLALGVGPGDRVAIYMPMSPEAAAASHACAHVGAIQVPIFSGFAAPAIVQRLVDSEAKVVITADYSLRRGSRVPMRETVEEARREAPSVEHVRRGARAHGVGGARPRRARAARGRRRASVPARVHLRDDRPAQGRAARARRLPALDRARGRLPVRHPRRRPRPLRDRHGLDHGPLDGRRRGRARRLRRLHGGRARPAGRPALAAGRGRARDDARRLADARPRPDPEGRARRRSLLAAGDHDDRRAVERRAVRLAERARRGRRPDPDREHLRRHRGGRLLPLGAADRRRRSRSRSASRRSARRWTSTRRRVGRCAARSASSSARGVAGDDARRSGATTSATSRRTGAASPASGRTATGRRSTRTATGSCTAAPTTRSTSPASGSGRPSSSRPRSTIPPSPRRRRSASRTR